MRDDGVQRLFVMPPDVLRNADRNALAAHLEPLFGHDFELRKLIASRQI